MIALAIGVLMLGIFYHKFVFIALPYYQLEPGTPQPNFKEAYEWIAENIPDYQERKYTVAETAVHTFYMGKDPEYAVRFSRTGLNMKQTINLKNDIYTNATVVDDTVNGTIGVYDDWATRIPLFTVDLTNATLVGDVLIVIK